MDTKHDLDFQAQAFVIRIGRLVRHHRRLFGLTICEVAVLARVSPTRLSRVERGLATPGLDWIYRVLMVLPGGVTLDIVEHHDGLPGG